MNSLRMTLPPLASLLPFEAAARLESFSKAAEELHLTQAAISRQIRSLEHDLGVKLFTRRNRAVFLTQEGRALAGAVSAALGTISASAVALRSAHCSNRVVLFCQLCEAFYWMMPRLSSFRDQHPGIELQVVTSTQPVADFNQHFDVALQTTGRSSGSHALAFTAADDVFPVCSPGYLPTDTPLQLDALAAHTLLHYHSASADFMGWEAWLQTFQHPLSNQQPSVVFDSYPLTLQAAVAGHGIALGWRRTAATLIEQGALVQPCAERIPLPEAISVYTQHGARERTAVQALLAWLHAQLHA
ncbi:LysR substrate-binding domain-containing protein [Pseudomonas sp. RP23018S]|uniref:LysR substrate-binding domain-containing protein n=1 Tax=Pseudomonas sp. RP23018S TaxID=3096037 RepID=UPI002ACAD89A|nr:LysR substrate-binding domain-containing protein [Pseudomonas sp. RP23018S]MDZ5603799.1 LysR substrate-binding domain-containing protein [Pseudomonas sp. RP23018S]